MKKTKLISYTQVHQRVFGYIVDRPSQAAALRIFSKARFEQAAQSYYSGLAAPASKRGRRAAI